MVVIKKCRYENDIWNLRSPFIRHLPPIFLGSSKYDRVELNDIKFEIHVEYYKFYGPLGRLSTKTVTGTSPKTKLFLPEYDMNFIQFLCHA